VVYDPAFGCEFGRTVHSGLRTDGISQSLLKPRIECTILPMSLLVMLRGQVVASDQEQLKEKHQQAYDLLHSLLEHYRCNLRQVPSP